MGALTVATASSAVQLLLANLPAIISTGEEVFSFVTKGIAQLEAAISGKAVTPEQLNTLILAIVALHNAIAAIP